MDIKIIFRIAFWILFGGLIVMQIYFSSRVHQAGERVAANRQSIEREGWATIGFLRDQDYQRIVCMGASMGGTACLKAAVDTDLAGVVVISSLWTTGNGSIGGALIVDREELAPLTLPKLFVTTELDGYGVPATMKAMYEAAPEPKTFEIIPGEKHGTDIFATPQGDEFRDLLVDFLVKLRWCEKIKASGNADG